MKSDLLYSMLIAALLVCAFADKIDDDFASFQKKQGKKYSTDEEKTYRSQVYRRNSEDIKKHNSDPSRTYDKGVNQFSDLTNQEFVDSVLMKASTLGPDVEAASNGKNRPDQSSLKVNGGAALDITSGTTTVSSTTSGDVKVTAYTPKDWAPQMTDVKNQANCGSCWAFTAVGLVEGGLKIKYGSTYNFAEQELVDCCHSTITSICSIGSGCNGGSSIQALNFMNYYGIAMESSYPYKAVRGYCNYNSVSNYGVINSAAPVTYVTAGSAAALRTSINAKPTGVYVDANSWQFYGGGIFNGCTYSGLNHGVIAVGYDSNGNWKLRNSWGAGWGSYGHIYIAGAGNPCGILNFPFTTTTV